MDPFGEVNIKIGTKDHLIKGPILIIKQEIWACHAEEPNS